MTIVEVLFLVVNFVGALVLFLYGMKLMSDGLQKFAGRSMRHIMTKITNNPLSGILVGAVLTVVIQSSSASTVMIVSFVNAGMMTLEGAIAMIMGANMGNTLITWILSLFALGDNKGEFSLPLMALAIALFFLFTRRDKLKSIGEFIIGFALLILSMELLQMVIPNLDEFPGLLEAMAHISDYGFLSVLLFTLIGTILTCAVQASAAIMAIALTMCYKGWIGFEVAMALVMGLNIGTTITANLAATMANVTGKKAARAHFVFNFIGVVITLIAFRPIMYLIDIFTIAITGSSPYTLPTDPTYDPMTLPWALCFFHTFFNMTTICVLVWFIPQLVRIVDWLVKPVSDEAEDEYRLIYIADNLMNTSELNIQSAKLEIENFSKRILRMYSFLSDLRTAKDENEFIKIFDRIKKYEGITDHMEVEIARFLTKISQGELSEQGSQRISSMLRVIDNLESIGDAIYQIALVRKDKLETAVHFDKHQNENLEKMTFLVKQALIIMDTNLHCSYSAIDLPKAYAAEDEINKFRDHLRAEHLDAIKMGKYDYNIGTVYSTLYALYEKLADFVINVSEAIDVDNSKKVIKY